MPSKRRRTSNPGTQADSTSLPGRDRFSCLPLELLAEILSSTSSKDVLAVARCSKSLCNILVDNESTEFIWRSARKQCKPYPLRNPTPNFTEASYAAFVFDFGNCEVRCHDVCFTEREFRPSSTFYPGRYVETRQKNRSFHSRCDCVYAARYALYYSALEHFA